MQNRKIYNKFIVDLACSLMMIIATTAIADSYTSKSPLRVTGEQDNHWALPQTPSSSSGFQQKPKTLGQQYQNRPIEKNNRGFRFVTPEILESIKQQQIQTQLMPENKQPPLIPHSSPGFNQNPEIRRQQYQGRAIEKNNRGFRFVTPEILESLKQQQTQHQLMPENQEKHFFHR